MKAPRGKFPQQRLQRCRFSPLVSDAAFMTCGFTRSLTTCRTMESHARVVSSTVRAGRLGPPAL